MTNQPIPWPHVETCGCDMCECTRDPGYWSGDIGARAVAAAIGIAAFLVVWGVSDVIGRIAEAASGHGQ